MEKGVPIRSITRSIAALKAINRHGSLSMMEIAKSAEDRFLGEVGADFRDAYEGSTRRKDDG